MKIRLPNLTHRTMIVGSTGSGKTVAALWHLSNYPLDRFPFVLVDFKTDEHVNSIPNAVHVDLNWQLKPKDTGVFIIHPLPQDAKGTIRESSPLEKFLWKLWEHENVGIFCDEGYMMQDNNAFESCLTQGRSKRIPMIVCSQRPAWISRFCFSESEFVQVFRLTDKRDMKTVEAFVPIESENTPKLDEFHSYYYDVGKDKLVHFDPVPSMDEIRAAFVAKLPVKRRWL